MPRDVQKWFGDHPRLRLVTDTAVSLTVDGLPATQADYLPVQIPWSAASGTQTWNAS